MLDALDCILDCVEAARQGPLVTTKSLIEIFIDPVTELQAIAKFRQASGITKIGATAVPVDRLFKVSGNAVSFRVTFSGVKSSAIS